MPAARALVWFKRDLRMHDHAPLVAAQRGGDAAGLFIIEPEWLQSPECDAQHVDFVLRSLDELRTALAARGMPLLVRVGSALPVLAALHAELGFGQLFSHEETGPGWSYRRDVLVGRWCQAHHVAWQDFTQTGVVRRLRSRSGWAGRWQARMDAPLHLLQGGFAAAAPLDQPALPTLAELGCVPHGKQLQAAGERAARRTLQTFLAERGYDYRKSLSSPLTAQDGCSRLSPHLAFGTLSLRTVHQATEVTIANTPDRTLAHALRGFAGRLRWHCHFMQKLEDEPGIEFHNFARVCDGLREDDFNDDHFAAWCEGRTGYPMVDACMRSLIATGWLNFRMRAMLVSFSSYHLWLHWREPGLFLARQFLDFEPGIHWSQMQMQSGTTGINTLRMYSPTKQAQDQDPEGLFIRRWVPELARVPLPYLAEPWKMAPSVQHMAGCHIGTDYPAPVVDDKRAMKAAKDRMYGLRQTQAAREEAGDVQARHGSRKSGLPPSGQRRPQRTRTPTTAPSPQGDLLPDTMPGTPMPARVRHLVIVLGDQLDAESSAFEGFDPAHDVVWMAEVAEESTHVWSTKQRTAVFLSAMRHFAHDVRTRGLPLRYTALDDDNNPGTLAGVLRRDIAALQPAGLVLTAPGDWRVLHSLRAVATELQLPLDLRDDTHFFSTVREFAAHAQGRKQLRLEYWYRALRQKHGILMDGKTPVGGQWNFDADNRESFGKAGPQQVPPPTRLAPDAITQDVIDLVNTRFASHPGTLQSFGWPVTRAQALEALQAFIAERLPLFGKYEDAMWAGEAWLYHSHLSCALNLKLINPREVVQAAEDAYRAGHAPLAAVEGFIRQILGWREYVRGIYWTQMPSYLERNALGAQADLPAWYWTGNTEMACLKDAIGQTLEHGYAHHIQRLMVTGLYALLLGVRPQAVHTWYLAVYVDAVEWVELPNTLGMGQFGDGGLMASKPYVASGKYIQRMSNHCQGCRYDPAQSTGPQACPFTTLYWDFLIQHEASLKPNARMAMQLKNLARLDAPARDAIRQQAVQHRLAQGV